MSPTAVTPSTDLVQKFDTIENTLNGVIFERPREIKNASIALISGKHFLMVGPPGVAKTLLVDTLVKLIDGTEDHYFRYLMTRFTSPEEIFGPPSLKALENDEYRRNTYKKLPQARISFLDEAFKASSSILNALLTLLNEGLFFNGPDVIECELGTLFAASNELPREAELAALWDRITFRHEVHPIKESSNRRRMFQARLIRESQKFTPVLSWDELTTAKAEARNVQVPDDVIDKLLELQDALRREGVEPTDRRMSDCIPIIQATAWRKGRGIAEAEDLQPLRNVLWVDIKDQPIVNQAVLTIANPLDKEALDLLNTLDGLIEEADTCLRDKENVNKARQKGVEIHGHLERVAKELEILSEKATKSSRRSELIEEGQRRVVEVAQRLLSELFNI